MGFIALTASIYILCCYALASIVKASDLDSFVHTIGDVVPVMSSSLRTGTGYLIIGAEGCVSLVIGLGLFTSSSTLVAGGIGMAAFLAAVFTCVLIHVLWRGDVVVCRCFGEADATITRRSLLSPIALVAASLVVWSIGLPSVSPEVWVASTGAGAYLLFVHHFLHNLSGLKPGTMSS